MVSQERIEELQDYFWSESDDNDTQEWRDDLSEEEVKLVEKWDCRYGESMIELCRKIIDAKDHK